MSGYTIAGTSRSIMIMIYDCPELIYNKISWKVANTNKKGNKSGKERIKELGVSDILIF